MTLEILTKEEADDRPCGKGRDEPNMNPTLEKPKLVIKVVIFTLMQYTRVFDET